MTPTIVSWLILLQIVVAIVALGLNIWGLRAAVLDYIYLNALGVNGGKRIVAQGNIRNIALRFSLKMLVLVMGIINYTIPSSENTLVNIILARVSLFFVLIALGLVAATVLDRTERNALVAQVRAARAAAQAEEETHGDAAGSGI